MDGRNHIIKKQFINLEAFREAGAAKAAQERLSRWGREKLPAIIGRVLDKLDEPSKVIRFDKITLDLDCEDLEGLEETLQQQLEKALTAALQQCKTEEARLEGHSLAQEDIQLLMFFLEKGYFPWSAKATLSVSEFEYQIAEALATEKHWAESIREVIRDSRALQRLVRQFSEKMRWRIAEALHPGIRAKLEPLLLELKNAGVSHESQTRYWQLVFNYPEAEAGAIRDMLRTEPAHAITGNEIAAAVSLDSPKGNEGVEDGIFIWNAGLVLLHPFLPKLFEATGYAEGKHLIQPEKTVLALQYAASGQAECPEWELPLPKILCGLALSTPVSTRDNPAREALDEVDLLLENVIRHWAVLKSTSINGLRESFLQRPGRLLEFPGNWTLRVEQKSIDVLLGNLPWGLSVIKLPWMSKPLFVEWA